MRGTVNKKRLILTGLLFAAASVLFSLASFFCPFSNRLIYNDSAIYQYIGYLITKGKTPYVDVFDHKGIYFYFLNALGYAIHPKWGMWVLIVLAVFANLVLVFRISRKFVPYGWSVLLALLAGSAVGCAFWDGDTPDFMALAFCLLAVNALTEYFLTDTLSVKHIVLSGAASAIAFWMKPNMILGVLVVCACIFIAILLRKMWRLAGICLAGYLGGFLLATLPGILWLGSRNALKAMFEDFFVFNFSYLSFSVAGNTVLDAFSYYISRPLSMLAFVSLLLFLFWMLLAKGTSRREQRGLLISGSAAFVVCLIHVSVTGNTYPQYMMLLIMPVILFLVGFVSCMRKATEKHKKLLPVLGTLAFACVLGFNARTEAVYCKSFWTAVPQQDEEIAYLEENSVDDDTIAVISPYFAGMYLASGRDSATKYVYVQVNHYANMTGNPESETEFWTEYTELLLENKPRIIVYDKGYTGQDDGIKEILAKCLDSYEYVGSSAYNEFYVLPDSETETIPEFVPKTKVDTSMMNFTLPADLVERYRNGEISLDEAMDEIMEEYDGETK